MHLFCGFITTVCVAIILLFVFALTGVPPTTVSVICLLVISVTSGIFASRKLNKGELK